MRYAKSIRYGGLWVDAQRADYQSYLNFALNCPYCGAPVYVNKGRSFSGSKKLKAYKTQSYFAHFQGVDATTCELRSKSSGKVSYGKSQALAKQQRKQKLEQLFELLLELSPRHTNWKTTRLMGYLNWIGQKKSSWIASLNNTYSVHKANISSIHHCLDETLDSFDDITERLNHLNYLKDDFELIRHREICHEVVNYMFGGGANEFLLDLLGVINYEVSWIKVVLHECKYKFSEERLQALMRLVSVYGCLVCGKISGIPRIVNQGIEHKSDICASSRLVAALIAAVPWAEGFELFELSKRWLDTQTPSLDRSCLKSVYSRRQFSLACRWFAIYDNSSERDIVIQHAFIEGRIAENKQMIDWWQNLPVEQSWDIRLGTYVENIDAPLKGNEGFRVVAAIRYNGINIFGPYSTFSITFRGQTVCTACFWFKLDDIRMQKKIGKLLKSSIETKYLHYAFEAPGLLIEEALPDPKFRLILTNTVSLWISALDLKLTNRMYYLCGKNSFFQEYVS